jgi:hypothetical protein
VAITTAFVRAVAPIADDDEPDTPANSLPPCQDFKGRLWDVLWLLRCALAGMLGREATVNEDGCQVLFPVRVYREKGFEGWTHRTGHEVVRLKAIAGAGDNGEPVLTLMLPEED